MCNKSLISQVTCCMEVLLEIQKNDPIGAVKPANENEAVLTAFRTNTHLAYKKLSGLENLESLVALYLTPCVDENCQSCGILEFFELCLVLLKLVNLVLQQEKEAASSESKPSGLLSISQQLTVRKCLQFVIALGIVPNLLPRVGIPQSKRMEYPDILTNVTFSFNPLQKYLLLEVTVEVLLDCLTSDALQGIIVFYHGCDLLAALMQICYAPVKKIDDKSNDENKSEPEKICKELNLVEKLSLIKDASPFQEQWLIMKMLENKSFFKPCLEKLMKEMCPSLLMFYLLMFHGISRNSNKVLRAPAWFQRECNLRLTKLLLKKNGIATLVEAVLNQTCDMDVPDITTYHTERLNGLARVIILNPVEQINQPTKESEQQSSPKQLINEPYMKELSKQVLELLCIKNNPLQQKVLNFVASSIILQVSDYDPKLAMECFWDAILKPLELWTGSDADVIVEERDLNICIDNLSAIFISGDFALSQPHIKILWPYFQTLFHLVNLINNVSYLKTQVKNLLCKILTSVDDEKALSFLQEVSFPAESCPGINVSFLLAEEGDVKEVAKVEEDVFLIQTRCHCIFDLLNEIQNKNLNSSYLLFILKEFCTFHKNVKEGKDEIYDEKYRITLALLSQEITAWEADLGEAFLSNVPEVIESLMILLENSHADDEKNAYLGEDIIMTVLMFLNSLLMIDDKLTPDDWAALQKCVPGLQRLHDCNIEPYLKAVIFNILAYVATHGAGATSECYAEIIKDVCSKYNSESAKVLGEHSKTECNSNEETSCNDIESSESKDLKQSSNKSCQASDVQPRECNSPCKSKTKPSRSGKKGGKSKAKAQKSTEFQSVMIDIEDDCIPTRGHGILSLGKLLSKKDEETLSHKEEILNLLQENLEHKDSYIYLSAIQTLSILAQIDTDLVLPVALKCLLHPEEKSSDYIIKMGEVLVKICRMLGDLTFKYREQLLHAYLVGAKSADPNVRSSSLSNLGEACFHLKFNIEGHWLQEILVCVQSLLITDRDLEVRRCAVMVIYLLLRGVGKDILQVLESNIKGIYMQLKVIYCTADDDVLRLHSQMALEEINSIMRHILTAKLPLLKEIRIL
ncbi:transport and Golgi organization protein 6 homolog [Uloborus diversus]|uniref:transport and Golgi organization protein 6 homolog n=1 Tax=Uloborus diversus TaxID=327109 RepID=UPI002408F488|nr:transport and Golgi organization protein 6 homolog [Uloborus diversus]